MNYTLTQAIDRAKDLSGILKAARAHEADCAADHVAKLNIATIAAEAHEKAVSACVELEQEREQLAEHIAALVRKVGEPLELDTPTADEVVQAIRPEFVEIITEEKIREQMVDRAWEAEAQRFRSLLDQASETGVAFPITQQQADERFNSVFSQPADFQAQALSNGLDRIGEALDAARS